VTAGQVTNCTWETSNAAKCVSCPSRLHDGRFPQKLGHRNNSSRKTSEYLVKFRREFASDVQLDDISQVLMAHAVILATEEAEIRRIVV
jgi:hypothetical protein